MRRNFPINLFLILLLDSCGPQPVPLATSTPVPSAPAAATQIVHAPEIRFALIGEPRDVNVWELFDESGASYVDYALRAEYWPRLYHLAPPELVFRPLAAEGLPSAVSPDGEAFSATVKLRTDLKWTDGSAFTAQDVAFTVNTALKFELGFDWSGYYPREYIDHVEAVDAAIAKFIFKKEPNVGAWQYAALQGPIVQKAYWEPLMQEASALLPDEALRAQVEEARTHLAETQSAVDDLTAQVASLKLNGQEDRKLEAALAARQNELTFSRNNLGKLDEEFDAKIGAAHQALYAVDDNEEPTLGTWMPAGEQNGTWVNEANPDFPFIRPNFDRAVYAVVESREEAFSALQDNKVDMILAPHDQDLPIPSNVDADAPSLNGSASFLIFNPERSFTVDPALHQAIACMLWHPDRSLSRPRSDFVLDGNEFWHNPDAIPQCGDLPDGAAAEGLTIERAVQILRAAGYSWEHEPAAGSPGSALIMPNGQPLPALRLVAPPDIDETVDPMEANVFGPSLEIIGISVSVEEYSPQDIRYEVFSSKQFDMAILGWRLSLYPGYLCQWFGAQGQFNYGSVKLQSECEALAVESDLDAARRHVFEIQSVLVTDLPFIPLYAGITYDAFRNIRYPFESVLGGLGGLYGAPSHAIP